MFLAVVPYNISPAVRLVAEKTSACCFFELSDDLLREPVRVGGLRSVRYDTRYLPMAYCRILACRDLSYASIRTDGGGDGILGLFITEDPGIVFSVDGEKSHFCQIWKRFVRIRQYRGKCVAAFVVELRGIRCAAYSKAVQNDKENTFCHKSTPSDKINEYYSSVIYLIIKQRSDDIALKIYARTQVVVDIRHMVKRRIDVSNKDNNLRINSLLFHRYSQQGNHTITGISVI